MATNTKKESEHNVEFAKGGDTHMFGQQAAGPDKPGDTGKDPSAAPGAKFAKGGGGKMFGYAPSQEKKSGITGQR